jgi:hypothetical protein
MYNMVEQGTNQRVSISCKARAGSCVVLRKPAGNHRLPHLFSLIFNGKLVLPERIELSTSPLPRECSTTELRQQTRRKPTTAAAGDT